MDIYSHTFIIITSLYICYNLGKVVGKRKGIESTLIYLLSNADIDALETKLGNVCDEKVLKNSQKRK